MNPSMIAGAVAAVALALTATAVWFLSWIPVALTLLVVVGWLLLELMNRLAPVRKPEPTATDLFAAIQEHRENTARDIEAIRASVNMATQRAPGRMLRE